MLCVIGGLEFEFYGSVCIMRLRWRQMELRVEDCRLYCSKYGYSESMESMLCTEYSFFVFTMYVSCALDRETLDGEMTASPIRSEAGVGVGSFGCWQLVIEAECGYK